MDFQPTDNYHHRLPQILFINIKNTKCIKPEPFTNGQKVRVYYFFKDVNKVGTKSATTPTPHSFAVKKTHMVLLLQQFAKTVGGFFSILRAAECGKSEITLTAFSESLTGSADYLNFL